MGKRFQLRGAAAVVAVIAILVLALMGAGYWYITQKGGLGGSSFDLAGHLPKSARAAWMVNLRGQVDPGEIKSAVDDVVARLSAEDKKKFEEEFKAEFGVSLEELLGFFDGRAAAAVTHQGEKPGVVALVGLRDSAGFAKLLKSKVPEGTKTGPRQASLST